MANAVITEKYVQHSAVNEDMTSEFLIPLIMGSVPWKTFLMFSIRCVLGMAVKPLPSSPFDLVALMNKT
jgi:hypothetical protein